MIRLFSDIYWSDYIMINQKNNSKLLQLIRKLKIHRVSLFFLLLGGLFLYLPDVEFIKRLAPLSHWLILSGQTLIIGGIITATYEYIIREETRSEMFQEIRNEISNSMNQGSKRLEKTISLYIARALMTDKRVQREVLRTTKINDIISTCLSTKLDEDMAEDLFEGVILPVLSGFENTAQRVMYNYNLDIRLKENDDNNINDEFYTLLMSVEYKYKIKIPQLKFACFTSLEDFHICLKDPTYTYAYYLPVSKLSGIMFDVSDVKMQCQKTTLFLEKNIDEENDSFKKIIFNHPESVKYIGKMCKLSYMMRTIIRKDGHMFFVRIKHPIRDFRAVFDTGNTDITEVSVSDQFVSSGGSMLQNVSDSGKIIKIVSVDGWIFPNSGVTFVWHY